MAQHRATTEPLTDARTALGRHVAPSLLDAWLERIFRPSTRAVSA